jgi:hypothetical protein
VLYITPFSKNFAFFTTGGVGELSDLNLLNICPSVQEYAAKSTAELRTVLFWVVTQQVVAIPY